MEVAAGRDAGTEWRIIDVGGSRSQVSRVLSFSVLLALFCVLREGVFVPLVLSLPMCHCY